MEALVVQCQGCRAPISVVAGGAAAGAAPGAAAPDDSFLVLEDVLAGRPPREGAASALAAGREESSFVRVVAGAADAPRVPLDARLRALDAALAAASDEARCDAPLCGACAGDVAAELEARAAEARADAGAYAAALAELEAEELQAGAGAGGAAADGDERLARLRGEAAAERAALAAAEADLAAAERELAAARAAHAALDAAEGEYWHAFNRLHGELAAAAAERDAVEARLEGAAAALRALRRADVLADVFHISHDGPLGTIAGLRLGRLAPPGGEAPPWDEVNAAWGAAVLLLAALGRAAGLPPAGAGGAGAAFPGGARLLPGGSRPRVADARGAHALWGPVSPLSAPGYNRAQCGFLGCLAALEAELAARGAHAPGAPPGARFALPKPVSDARDAVGGESIRTYGDVPLLSRDARWARALKYMLLDLKFCLAATLELAERGGRGGDGGGGGGSGGGGAG